MTDFNLWTLNSRVFPGIDPLPVRLGDSVRIASANLSMNNHPIHLHGHSFAVTGTDGGWIPGAAQWPEVTTDVPVGADPRASISSPTIPATGRSTATSRITR